MNNKKDIKLAKIYKLLKLCKDTEFVTEAMKYINTHKQAPFFEDDILVDVFAIIVKNNINFQGVIEAEKLYNLIVSDKNNERQRMNFLKLLNILFVKKHGIISLEMIENIYILFENEKYSMGLFNAFDSDIIVTRLVMSEIYSYILQARQYYVDEGSLYSSILQVIAKIKELVPNINLIKITEIIDRALERDKKLAGLYDIDEAKIEASLSTLKELNEKQEKLEQKIADCLKIINNLYEDIEKKIAENKSFNKDVLLEIREAYAKIQNITSEVNSDNVLSSSAVIDLFSSKLDNLIQKLTRNNLVQNNTPAQESRPSNQQLLVLEQKRNITINDDNFFYNMFLSEIKGKIRKSILEISNCDCNFNIEEKEIEFEEKLKEIINFNVVDKNMMQVILNNLKVNDNTFMFLRGYYWALYNDSVELLKILIEKISISKLDIRILSKNVINLFKQDEYLDLAINRSGTLIAFINVRNVELLARLNTINPNYKLAIYDSGDILSANLNKLIKAIELFGIEIIAANHENLDKMLEEFSIEFYLIIKRMFDINQSFEIYISLYPFTICMKFFDVSEFAFFTKQEQERLARLMTDYAWGNDDMKEMFDKLFSVYYEDVIKLISSNSNICISCWILEMIDNSIISMDGYLSLDYEKSCKIINIYESKHKNKKVVSNYTVKKLRKKFSDIK